eukprot:TRINITY_DN16355_c0_g1_i2.p1 TRINITY_DN16355_c0_g1~~TRINITY_DN16355_c0_g1_i2.p1  ORF type:complete len:147 (-),score=9.57 TRINITY_DN16355_c0_g1_i2:144-584(-)
MLTDSKDRRETLEHIDLHTPLDTPREVFCEGSEPQPRGEHAHCADAFQIPLATEVFRRARAQRLNRQKNLGFALMCVLIAFILLGCAYFNPFQFHIIKGTDDWSNRVSQLSFIFSLIIFALFVNLMCLLNICYRQRNLGRNHNECT